MKKSVVTWIADLFCTIESGITSIVFFGMLVMILIQVVCRYYLHLPLAWTEELLRFLYIGASFFGAIVATRQRKHVEINFISTVVKKAAKDEKRAERIMYVLDLAVMSICCAFCGFMAYLMFGYMIEVKNQGQLSIAMQLPMWLIISTLVISMGLCSFHYLLNFIETIQLLIASRKEGAA